MRKREPRKHKVTIDVDECGGATRYIADKKYLNKTKTRRRNKPNELINSRLNNVE